MNPVKFMLSNMCIVPITRINKYILILNNRALILSVNFYSAVKCVSFTTAETVQENLV